MIIRNPSFLLFLLLIPVVFYRIKTRIKPGALHYPTTMLMRPRPTWRSRLAVFVPYLPVLALVLLILALARPQSGRKETLVRREGIDIVIALDVSTSMLAEDFVIDGKRTNRLEIVKQVTREFMAGRPHDRIGMVIFAAQPYVLSPLTWDHNWVESRLQEITAGMIEDGTAIGTALTAALNRLRASSAQSKVVILLTDGVNNAGQISPELAAEAAQALGIKVYTIGAGSEGPVPYPVQDHWGRTVYQTVELDLDEELLQKIAAVTNGAYFRATNTKSLKQIFQEIDRLERSVIEMPQYQEYIELYPWFLLCALLLLLAETILANTVCRRLP